MAGKRGRGRPRKVIKDEPTEKAETSSEEPAPSTVDPEAVITVPSSVVVPSEQESSAVEGLLGLSELGKFDWMMYPGWFPPTNFNPESPVRISSKI